MIALEKVLQLFGQNKVDFIIVGGAAAIVHGSTRLTQDLDLVYSRGKENLEKIVQTLKPYHPYLRGAPEGLPFFWDIQTLNQGLNFTLTTDLGSVDLLGEITGGGNYQDLLPHTITIELFGIKCLCLNLDKLIATKKAAGRPKDLEAVAELTLIQQASEKMIDSF